MELTHENYFSNATMREYMSCSQFKQFLKCQSAVMAELNGEYAPPSKDCFTEGHLFEAVVCGKLEQFKAEHPEMVSSTGKTKGQIKTNFSKVLGAGRAFNRHSTLTEIINRCEKQKIIYGTINGVPYKGCIDLYDPITGDIWDTKCMRSFESQYSADEGRRVEWWQAYGYHYQAAIYRELTKQMGLKFSRFGLMAASKEEVPDVVWIEFDKQLIDNAYDVVYEFSPTFQAVKLGMIDAEPCGHCDYCKSVKKIEEPTLIRTMED